jgi:protein-tyrosine phosphatase
MDGRPESISILAVCDGNVCRSPSAQFAISVRLPRARVESAGIRARSGSALCDVVADAIVAERAAAGSFTSTFRSRRLGDVTLGDFDVTLTATTGIRGELARAHPELRDRFFTFREAADVLSALCDAGIQPDPFDPSALVATMNRHRGAAPTTADLPPRLRMKVLDRLDIPDGHGERAKRHRAVVQLALTSAEAIGDSLARLHFA